MKKAKTDYTAERISLNKTRGGLALPEMSQTSRDLVDMLNGSASFSGIPGLEQKQIDQDTNMEFSTSHKLWEVDEIDNEIDLGEVTYTVPQLGSVIKNQPVSSREENPHTQSTSATKSNPSQSKPKTLKDLQMEYYSQAIALHKVQIECFSKVSKLADIMIDKVS